MDSALMVKELVKMELGTDISIEVKRFTDDRSYSVVPIIHTPLNRPVRMLIEQMNNNFWHDLSNPAYMNVP